MPVLRSLPPRPSLEYNRKEAKTLLRQLRAGDPDSIARALAQHPTLDVSSPERMTLIDAQLVIAREYGFASWPRMVQYCARLENESPGIFMLDPPETYSYAVDELLAGHKHRQPVPARQLAAYVPRFYGMRAEDVLDAEVTIEDARLAVARGEGCPSWSVLIEQAKETRARVDYYTWETTPLQRAWRAIETADLAALQDIVRKHPDLLAATENGRHALMSSALLWKLEETRTDLDSIIAWLETQGQSLQLELSIRLCGEPRMVSAHVPRLLDMGADPNWISPSGIPVLELALLHYWNREAVDMVATRATPRKALWIAAALGDVRGVSRFLDKDGKPTAAARKLRPPFRPRGILAYPQLPDPSDEELLMEAFFLAILNDRVETVDYLASRGCNVSSLFFGQPLLIAALQIGSSAMVECLLRHGANPDTGTPGFNQFPKDIARGQFLQHPTNADYRRIVELFGMNPDTILTEHHARPLPVPTLHQKLQESLALAEDDAFRLNQTDVHPANLLFGMLRFGELAFRHFTRVSRMDRERFYADVKERVDHGKNTLPHEPLPMHPDARKALDAAIAMAVERRRETVTARELLYVMLQQEHGIARTTLARYEGNTQRLIEQMKRGL